MTTQGRVIHGETKRYRRFPIVITTDGTGAGRSTEYIKTGFRFELAHFGARPASGAGTLYVHLAEAPNGPFLGLTTLPGMGGPPTPVPIDNAQPVVFDVVGALASGQLTVWAGGFEYLPADNLSDDEGYSDDERHLGEHMTANDAMLESVLNT